MNLQICGDVDQLDDRADNSEIPRDRSGGSSTAKYRRFIDELVPIGSTCMDLRRLKVVHDPPVEALSGLKHLDNQPGFKSADDRRFATQSELIGTFLEITLFPCSLVQDKSESQENLDS